MGKIKRRLQHLRQPVRPRLIPPVKGWAEDLPDSADELRTPPQLLYVNEINDIWMEIPRYVNHGWSGLWFISIILLFCLLWYCFFLLIPSIIFNGFVGVLEFFILFSFVLFWFRIILFEPRGAPIRFNRKRQKVYAYEYQRGIWPWKRWPVKVKVFDWADIHAERVLMAGHADWGHRIYCAVCKPGTFEVVDRFILTWTVGSIFQAYGLWSHCCHYMEGKPVPINPLWTERPRSWTPFNTVRWPEEIDRESRTAPDCQPGAASGAEQE
ncbi:hypothetical protein GJV78_22320 [Escherichia alba]|uniref:DUF6708 domain-containing protein n=1 Tax=Intestinirhabdus alba TaxID=2899544 RepID=A0A6L6ISF5_9ENTR|nr:hypothetical protein [Intestinirhabdus alba]